MCTRGQEIALRQIVLNAGTPVGDLKYCFDTADLKDAKAVLDELSR
jgi:tRNA (Thr-GGU) A37 N-methylase